MNYFVKETQNQCASVGLPTDCKILLLLNNSTVYPDPLILYCDNVVAHFLPPNTNFLIQFMSENIIQSLKWHNRTEFLKKILNFDTYFQLEEYKMMFTIKNTIYLLAESWNSVSKSTLVNGWLNFCPSSLF